MEIIGPLILSLIGGLSTMIGCIFIYLKIKKIDSFITFSLSLSMTIMILISLFDLIPESLISIFNEYKLFYAIIASISAFLIGFMIIYLMHEKVRVEESKSLYRVGIISMILLILHNIPEGAIVFLTSYKNIRLGFKLILSIILHNIPEGIIIAVPLFYSGKSRGSTLFHTLIASLSEPLGALLAFILFKNLLDDTLLSVILLFVSGLMISLSINDIYKEAKKYNKPKFILYGIISAIILYILISLI